MNLTARLQLVDPPARQAVSTRDAKAYLRVEHRDEDSVIDQLVLGATSHLENFTRRALVTQTWDLFLDHFPGGREPLELPKPPLVSVDEVEFVQIDGQTGVLDPDVDLKVLAAGICGAIEPVFGTTWPATRAESQAVRVRFTCGYGTTLQIPEDLKTAIAMLAATYYENREDFATGTIAQELPRAVRSLAYPFRVLNTAI